MSVKKVSEQKRGCGYRKKGGLYLMGGASSTGCCKLPFPLTVCKSCGGGIKQTRGFTWINSDLFQATACTFPGSCPFSKPEQALGLICVGESYYKTPSLFSRESEYMGISRRIAQLPRGMVAGKTWVALAHPKAITIKYGTQYSPGIFSVFLVTEIQYVVTGRETTEELDRLEKRGIQAVEVVRAGEQLELNTSAEPE